MQHRRTYGITCLAIVGGLLSLTALAHAQQSVIPLYPGAAPGSEEWDWSERSATTRSGLPMVRNVVRPERIGMIGFSAGGLVTTEPLFSPTATRPNFAAIIYGAGEIRPTPNPAPSLFLAVAGDDSMVEPTVEMFTAYRNGGGAAELHVFQMGAHGFLNKGGGADHFMDRVEEWLRGNSVLSKSAD